MNLTNLSFIALCFSINVKAQTTDYVDANNVKGLISDNGIFFNNSTTSSPSYEYPKDGNSFISYAMSYWMGAKDNNGQLYLAANTFGIGQDMFAGPIADDYNSAYYTSTYPAAIWKISRDQINYHINNYTSSGYTPSTSISNWPANGNTSEGIAAHLAPYVDANNDQIYNPMDGDYPYIQGDQAVYTIMNDAAGSHTESGGEILGVEIHSMFYQYNTTDDVNNTTFLNVKIYNRSSTDYVDFYFGIQMDNDIGDGNNDYSGCDTTKNLGYSYNESPIDNGPLGQSSYGYSPPAFGTKFLNREMGAYISFSNTTTGPQGYPASAIEFYNNLKGLWKDGSSIIHGGTGGTTNFTFSGIPSATGWTELSSGNPIGDRRFVIVTEKEDLIAQSSSCIDLAFIVNNDSEDHLENVDNLLGTADFIQNFYDNNILPCSQFVATNNEYFLNPEISIFPNPSKGFFTLRSNESFIYKIYDLNGKVVTSNNIYTATENVELDIEQGVYIVEMKNQNFIHREKIEIIE